MNFDVIRLVWWLVGRAHLAWTTVLSGPARSSARRPLAYFSADEKALPPRRWWRPAARRRVGRGDLETRPGRCACRRRGRSGGPVSRVSQSYGGGRMGTAGRLRPARASR